MKFDQFFVIAAGGGIFFIFASLALLHIFALLGFGEGSPFTAKSAATQRFYKGDLSLFCAAISILIYIAMIVKAQP